MEDKIKKIIKNKNNYIFFVILILGIMMMTASGGGKKISTDSEEKRLEKILNNISDIGKTSVYITYDKDERLKNIKKAASAVVIVDEDNSYVRKMVSEVTSNVLEIPIHKVMIVKKE